MQMKVWTVAEAASELKICKETLRRFCREGAPHRRIGRKILFTAADITALMERSLMTEVNPFARKDKQKEWNTNATSTTDTNTAS